MARRAIRAWRACALCPSGNFNPPVIASVGEAIQMHGLDCFVALLLATPAAATHDTIIAAKSFTAHKDFLFETAS